MTADWPGVIDADVLNPKHVAIVDRLADRAKAGDWTAVLELLESGAVRSANHWRITGKSWFTPLHQAAWLGAPLEVVERLVELGGWRSLRTAEGHRPIDLAEKRGHRHLYEVLEVRRVNTQEQRRFAAWDEHFADLIRERTQRLAPVRFRPLPTESIALDHLDTVWFAYPGMYGGFGVSVHKQRLFVESWSRVAGGSGQAHVITEGGCVLVEEGFV